MKDKKKLVQIMLNQELDVTIDGIGAKGDGMARIEGLVIFVKGKTEKGDEVKIKITKILSKYAFAELV